MLPESDVPKLYHAHHNRHLEDLPFWLSLASRYGSPILELGCVTGRIFTPLCKAGYLTIGLDSDAAMLAFIREHWDDRQHPALILGNMTSFHFPSTLALIILPCNTYSTLTTQERRQTLACVRNSLRSGGTFAVSMPNPQALKSLLKESAAEVEEIFPHPLDGEPVQVSSAWRRFRKYFWLEWHYDHLLPDGRVERTTLETHHTLESATDLIKEFHMVGFEKIKTYGDFDESAYAETSPYLIIVAEF